MCAYIKGKTMLKKGKKKSNYFGLLLIPVIIVIQINCLVRIKKQWWCLLSPAMPKLSTWYHNLSDTFRESRIGGKSHTHTIPAGKNILAFSDLRCNGDCSTQHKFKKSCDQIW